MFLIFAWKPSNIGGGTSLRRAPHSRTIPNSGCHRLLGPRRRNSVAVLIGERGLASGSIDIRAELVSEAGAPGQTTEECKGVLCKMSERQKRSFLEN